MKKVFKYGTGDEIPEGAVYLSTQVETEVMTETRQAKGFDIAKSLSSNLLVWHYFLVEIKDA